MSNELIFHEMYGYLTERQLQLYKTCNVSPADHDLLIDRFATDSAALMTYVTANSVTGIFIWKQPFLEDNDGAE